MSNPQIEELNLLHTHVCRALGDTTREALNMMRLVLPDALEGQASILA